MTSGPLVDGDDIFTFPHLVKWVEMVTRAETERAMGGMPVSSGQLFVLALLKERGEATSADLARMMRITPQALTTLLRPLREEGYITRRVDENHARRLQLRLTDKSQAILAEARRLAPGIEDSLLAGVSTAERTMLKRLLMRIARRFDHS